MKSHHYWKAVDSFKLQLRDAVPHAELKALHARSGPRHLAYAARQFAIIGACSYALWHLTNPWLWLPFAVLQGFTFFNMTTLLHEVVHNSVFDRRRNGWNRALGLALREHERDLGQPVHALAPRPPRQPRLVGGRPQAALALAEAQRALVQAALLHAGADPALLPRRGQRGALVPEGAAAHDRARARRDGAGAASAWPWRSGTSAAGAPLLRVWAVPYFLVFPVAFTLNRLGQHYNIDPTHPLKWSTVMAPSRIWDFLFVYSNYHAEHHYFPSVPFYNLRKLHLRLRPLYAAARPQDPHLPRDRLGVVRQNRAPHTDWDKAAAPTGGATAAHRAA